MYMAAIKEDTLKVYDHFMETYEAKYSKMNECLKKLVLWVIPIWKLNNLILINIKEVEFVRPWI